MNMNQLLRRACVALVWTLWAAGVSHAVLQDGLVSYWPMDGNFSDARGINPGTFVGGGTPAFSTGKFGQGIDLNGVDQFVNVGNSSSLDMSLAGPAQNGHVSISAWFRVDAFDITWQALLAKGEGSNYRIARRDAGSVISYAGGSGDIPTMDLVGPSVNDGTLHHVVAISENAVSTRLWVDGTLVETGAAPTLGNMGNSDLFIGENVQARGRYWDGLIDDVAIWNRVLTDAEVASLWAGGAGASVGSLIPAPPAPGDVNGDGSVNNADFEIIRGNFLESVTSRADGDLNLDGLVDFADFREWKDSSAGSASASAVPEPSVLLLAALASVSFVLTQRRKG
jgi:hypothetical protein